MSFEESQDGHRGGHLGYWNRTILAILNFCVTVMLPIKFWLNPTYTLGGDVVWRISRWPPWWPSWISEWNNLSYSESLFGSDASHKVLAQSDLWFWRNYRLKNFKMAAMADLEYRNGTILAILNLCQCDASHQVLAQSDLRFGRRCRLKNFKAAILDIGMERF